jgi:hypothetical protein
MRVLALIALAVAVAAVSVEVRLSKTALKLGTCVLVVGAGAQLGLWGAPAFGSVRG